MAYSRVKCHSGQALPPKEVPSKPVQPHMPRRVCLQRPLQPAHALIIERAAYRLEIGLVLISPAIRLVEERDLGSEVRYAAFRPEAGQRQRASDALLLAETPFPCGPLV